MRKVGKNSMKTETYTSKKIKFKSTVIYSQTYIRELQASWGYVSLYEYYISRGRNSLLFEMLDEQQ